MTEPDSKASVAGGLSLLERVNDFGWAAQALAAALFLDLALVATSSGNLLHWSAQTDALLKNSGLIVVGVAAYAVLASMVLPMASSALRSVLREIGQIPLLGWITHSKSERQHKDYVLSHALREHALINDDKGAKEAYETHSKAVEQSRRESLRLEGQVFLVLTALLANAFAAGWLDGGKSTLVELGATALDWRALAFGGLCLFLVSMLRMCWFDPPGSSYAYYPPLYRKQVAEREEREHAYRFATAKLGSHTGRIQQALGKDRASESTE